jgi:ribonuclease-3
MSPRSQHPSLARLEDRLGYRFQDPEVLLRAVTHSSFANEAGPGAPDNEGLEFLGDSVLSFLVAEMLFREEPEAPEGAMSRAKAWLVADANLARVALELGVGEHLRLGVGERRSHGRDKPSVLADALEAILAAVFLDGGIGAARRMVRRLFRHPVREIAPDGAAWDSKTALQELLQGRGLAAPTYQVVAESGPDHRKIFRVEVCVDDRVLGQGSGPSKKAAEQQAAQRALEALEGRRGKGDPVGPE